MGLMGFGLMLMIVDGDKILGAAGQENSICVSSNFVAPNFSKHRLFNQNSGNRYLQN